MGREVEDRGFDLIAVDGGASRCRLAAFDARGARVAEVSIDAPASLTLGEDDAWRTIRAGIERLVGMGEAVAPAGAEPDVTTAVTRESPPTSKGGIEAASFGASSGDPSVGGLSSDGLAPAVSPAGTLSSWWPATLALGLAGSLQEARRTRFLELVARETDGAVRCHLVTDGHAQLVGASLGRPGACLSIGTGSVVHWLASDGSRGMAGGWGFPIGDEGSGAWLGACLLQRYLWHRDGQTSDSPLMSALESGIGDSVSAVQRVTTDARSTTHARLARLVVEASEGGDALASSLLDEGSEWCARLVERAPSGLPVHVVGGLATAYASRLATRFGSRLLPARGDALDGLVLIARGVAT